MLGGVGTALAVLSWTEEEEEDNPSEIADGDIFCNGSLGGGVQGLDNAEREGPHSCWRMVLDSGRAKCSLLRDSGRGGSRTSSLKIHRRRVLPDGWIDVRSDTGARDHL